MTVISFDKTINDIENFVLLPIEIQNIIKESDSISSKGFQELNGYKNRKNIWSCMIYWNDDKCIIQNFGGIVNDIHVTWEGRGNIVKSRDIKNISK
jgi:hypothetical protein